MSGEVDGDYFELTTSVRYDTALIGASWKPSCDGTYSPFLLLPYHFDRLRDAILHFKVGGKCEDPVAKPILQGMMSGDREIHRRMREKMEMFAGMEEQKYGPKPFRMRVVVSPEGIFEFESYMTAEREYDLLALSTFDPASSVLQSPPFPQPTKVYLDFEPTPVSDFTRFKTSKRKHYSAARERAGIDWDDMDTEVLVYDDEGNIMEGTIRNVAFWRDDKWVSPVGGGLKGVMRRWLLEQGRVVEGVIPRKDVKIGETVLLTNAVEGCTLGIITDEKQSCMNGKVA